MSEASGPGEARPFTWPGRWGIFPAVSRLRALLPLLAALGAIPAPAAAQPAAGDGEAAMPRYLPALREELARLGLEPVDHRIRPSMFAAGLTRRIWREAKAINGSKDNLTMTHGCASPKRTQLLPAARFSVA